LVEKNGIKSKTHHPSDGWLELIVTWWWQIRLQSLGSKTRTLDPEVPWSMAQTSLTGGSSSDICKTKRDALCSS